MSDREEPLRIWWNKNLDGKISRGKLAAHAAHAALAAYGIKYTHAIVVLAAGKGKIEAMPINIRDAGHTELEEGTLTTGVEDETHKWVLSEAYAAGVGEGIRLAREAAWNRAENITDDDERIAYHLRLGARAAWLAIDDLDATNA